MCVCVVALLAGPAAVLAFSYGPSQEERTFKEEIFMQVLNRLFSKQLIQ